MNTETATRPDYQPYTDWHCVHHRDETYAGPVLYILVDETETTATPLCTECVQKLLLAFAAQQEAEADRRPRSFEVLTVAAYIEALRGMPPIGCPWPGYARGRDGRARAIARRRVRSPLLSSQRDRRTTSSASLVEDAMGHACAHPREHREY